MNRVLIGIALVLAALVVILGTITLIGWRSVSQPLNTGVDEPVLVRIQEGDSVAAIAAQLKEKHLIRSAFWFRVAARVTGATLDTGLYHLQANESALRMLTTLAAGDVAEVQVTLPEGWRSEEILDRLTDKEVVTDRTAFAAATQQTATYPTLVERLKLTGDEPLEGFLFPDTYRFDIEADSTMVVTRMVDTFLDRTVDLSLTYDTVILASIVEREAQYDEDRAPIAGVYANRLAAGMALEADPTVQYAKSNRLHGCSDNTTGCATLALRQGLRSDTAQPAEAGEGWWPAITAADYRHIESPFNTYLHAGLPPAPICNPGLASLEAAAAPAEHDYLYFVTDTDGKAHFATTLAEHQANKTKYLR